MNEDKLETAIHRAARAEALLRDEILTGAFDKLEADYIAAWRISPVRDVIAREKLWQAVNIVGKVKEHLSKIVAGGTLAKAEVNMRQKQPR